VLVRKARVAGSRYVEGGLILTCSRAVLGCDVLRYN
jgi:hypothetical protein